MRTMGPTHGADAWGQRMGPTHGADKRIGRGRVSSRWLRLRFPDVLSHPDGHCRPQGYHRQAGSHLLAYVGAGPGSRLLQMDPQGHLTPAGLVCHSRDWHYQFAERYMNGSVHTQYFFKYPSILLQIRRVLLSIVIMWARISHDMSSPQTLCMPKSGIVNQ